MDPARNDEEELDVPWFLEGVTVLSPEGSREILDEIRNGTPLTPERAATFERARQMSGVRKRSAALEQGRHRAGEPIILSPEGSREVEEEIRNGSPLTPERRAMFERMRRREEVRKRLAAEAQAAKIG
jgi:hypothetical protein